MLQINLTKVRRIQKLSETKRKEKLGNQTPVAPIDQFPWLRREIVSALAIYIYIYFSTEERSQTIGAGNLLAIQTSDCSSACTESTRFRRGVGEGSREAARAGRIPEVRKGKGQSYLHGQPKRHHAHALPACSLLGRSIFKPGHYRNEFATRVQTRIDTERQILTSEDV